MTFLIDFQYIKQSRIYVIPDGEVNDVGAVQGKRWSFINVYHLIELKNIYLALKESAFSGDIKAFLKYCQKHVPYEKDNWTYRRVEEYINALRNFGILSINNTLNTSEFNFGDNFGDLTLADKIVLKYIYFSYYRFKEVHTWFVNIESKGRKELVTNFDIKEFKKDARKIYSFSRNKKFTDSFYYDENAIEELFVLDEASALDRRMMRFWDVYVKWGRVLGLLEKISVEPLSKSTVPYAVSCTYHLTGDLEKVDLVNFIRSNYGTKKTFIAEIVFKLATENHVSIGAAKSFIIDQYLKNREIFSIDFTSEIFITTREIDENDNLLYPLYRGSYISHLTLVS